MRTRLKLLAVLFGTFACGLTITGCLRAHLHNAFNPGTPTGFLLSGWDPPSTAPGITITTAEGNGAIDECGKTAAYDLVLDSQPSADVTVQMNFDSSQLVVNDSSVSPLELNFTPENWNQAQHLTITALDDSIPDEGIFGTSIDFSVTSGDLQYDGFTPENISLTVTDNDEYQINSYTGSYQSIPAISLSPTGSSVVVWESLGQDGDGFGIFGQRFDSNGNPLGAEFQINSNNIGSQRFPDVAMGANGDFVVVWTNQNQIGAVLNIYGRRFDSNGTALGLEFPINTYTNGDQESPAIAITSTGDFVAVWESYGQDGDQWGIFGRRYDSSGNPLGNEFNINTTTVGAQIRPVVVMDPTANFIAVWVSWGQDGDLGGIYGRRFEPNGNPLGPEFRINTYTIGDQGDPNLAMDFKGNFMVVWMCDDQYGHPAGIYGQRFDSTGVRGHKYSPFFNPEGHLYSPL